MGACPGEEVMLDFVEARLAPGPRGEIEAHVASCGVCAALVATLAEAWHAEGKLGPGAGFGPALAPGEALGRYEVAALAGAGAMGEVYRARDARLGREVALKVLPPRFASDPRRLARFLREGRAAAALRHPNLVTVYDVVAEGRRLCVVSEWVEGETLRAFLRRGPLAPGRALGFARQLARGLAAAHGAGVVHRDVKPENVLVGPGDELKVVDFGLAKLLDASPEASGTEPGAVLGSAGYMAPEQVRGGPVDHRADVFALGVLLYEMLSGRPAFGGASAVDRMHAALHDEPPPLPGEAWPLVARCLAKDPAARYQSALDLAFHLEWLAGRVAPAAPSAPAVAPSASGAPAPAAPSAPPAAPAPRGRQGARRAAAALLFAAACSLAFAAGLAAKGRPRPAPPPAYRPLSVGDGFVLTARFSPDAHTVVYGASWGGRPVELFATRTERADPRPLGLGADVLSISKRGEMAVALGRHFLEGANSSGTLARVPLHGGPPRPLRDDVQDADWAPEGDALAAVCEAGGRYRLEYPLGRTLYESGGWLSHVRVAPGGGLVAFLEHPNPQDDRGSLLVLDREGRRAVASEGWVSLEGVAWAPGGAELWFGGSREDGENAIYALGLDGRERLVDRAPGRLIPHDVAADGRALVVSDLSRVRLLYGAAGEASERELTWTEGSYLGDVAADGTSVVFAEVGAGEGATYGTYLRRLGDDLPVRLGEGWPVSISADGAKVLALRYGSPPALVVLPTGAGQERALGRGGLAAYHWARWFPDGRRVLVAGAEAGRPPRLWLHDVDAERPRPLTPEGFCPTAVISPDGARLLAVDEAGRLRFFEAESGRLAGEVPGAFAGTTALVWGSDGGSAYLRTRAMPVRIVRVDLATGRASPHPGPRLEGRAGVASVFALAMAPDGRSYAYSPHEVRSRLFLVEGLGAPPAQ
ncbi:MAG: protein kinase [Polyangiaceae bacterium]|nr:protein kinase [Polyangiaceae bacterium]